MGTPDFAAGALQAIVDSGHDVRLVVTQPDKVRGRGGMVSASPVKECALKNNIEVFQPVKIKEKENVDRLKSIDADVYVVAAFGQILSEEILNIPPFGCINIHASLLPKYRGAAPIQWCILNGETKTGVTIMQMDKGVDTGDILYTKTIDIDSKETGEGLFDKLSALGAEAICEALPLLEQGKLKAMPQDESEATHVGMLKKEMGEIDWKRSACEIERLIDEFHLSDINNHFVSSAIINFNNGDPGQEIKSEIERGFNEKFCGASNGGRVAFSWNPNKESATDIVEFKMEDFGERYKALSQHSRIQIFTSFRAIPLLFGLTSEVNTGFSTEEFEQSFKLYNRTQIQPVQRMICDAYDKIYGQRGVLTIRPFSLGGDTEDNVN